MSGCGFAELEEEASETDERQPLSQRKSRDDKEAWLSFSWSMVGPGLLCCLADTDAGCLLVAAQSGARWGYRLLPLQVVLIPVLFMAQELTVRLGVFTKQGHSACIRQHFGPGWCWFATVLLVFECICAMVSEMSGVAAVGRLWGLEQIASILLSAALIVTAVVALNYKQIEVIGITLGLFELTFVGTMAYYHPPLTDVISGSLKMETDPEYLKLIAANIGAVIMPWMIYFQQSAVVARRLVTQKDLSNERGSTLLGSILTQLIMIGALVTLAAVHKTGQDLHSMTDIVVSLEPALGQDSAKILVSFAFLGGSLCAAFVVSLAATWAICEAAQMEDPGAINESPVKAPHFYACFLAVVLAGIAILLGGVNVVKLNVMVELLDGVLMPVAVGFLYLLAISEALPPESRVTGLYKWVLGVVFSLCALVSLTSAFAGMTEIAQ